MVRYVFEKGAAGRDEAEKMLRRLKADPNDREKFRIHGYDFEGKETVPLQAADFLAYESYRQIDNRVVDGVRLHKGRPIEPRGALRCLLDRASGPSYARSGGSRVHLAKIRRVQRGWRGWPVRTDRWNVAR